jgi:hypothetical protein
MEAGKYFFFVKISARLKEILNTQTLNVPARRIWITII